MLIIAGRKYLVFRGLPDTDVSVTLRHGAICTDGRENQVEMLKSDSRRSFTMLSRSGNRRWSYLMYRSVGGLASIGFMSER